MPTSVAWGESSSHRHRHINSATSQPMYRLPNVRSILCCPGPTMHRWAPLHTAEHRRIYRCLAAENRSLIAPSLPCTARTTVCCVSSRRTVRLFMPSWRIASQPHRHSLRTAATKGSGQTWYGLYNGRDSLYDHGTVTKFGECDSEAVGCV